MPDTPTSSASSSMEPPVVRGLEKARAGSQVGQQTRRQAGSPGRTGRGRRTPTLFVPHHDGAGAHRGPVAVQEGPCRSRGSGYTQFRYARRFALRPAVTSRRDLPNGRPGHVLQGCSQGKPNTRHERILSK